jgi:hypothetical protein
MPPSTTIATPTTDVASSDARYADIAAISPGCYKAAVGLAGLHRHTRSRRVVVAAGDPINYGVSTVPGAMRLGDPIRDGRRP